MKRRIQPLQARETLGFEYQGTSDPSRYSEEEISDEEVPFIPDTFSAANPPKQVQVKVVDLCLSSTLSLARFLIEFAFMLEDVDLYKSSPPLPGTYFSFFF